MMNFSECSMYEFVAKIYCKTRLWWVLLFNIYFYKIVLRDGGGCTHILDFWSSYPLPSLNVIMTIEENIKLDKYTTFGVGGYARYFAIIQSIDDLKEAVEFSKENKLSILVLAGGSNVLISDDGFNGIVLKMEIFGIEYNDNTLIVGAGEKLDSFVADVVSKDIYGIENLSGIPGTVGATPVQNVGAYGVEVSNLISWVEVYDIDSNEITKLSNEECNFSYRDSIFKKNKNYIITRVCFKLNEEKELTTHYKDIKNHLEVNNITNPTVGDIRNIVLEIRRNKFPDLDEYGTAGSFFKNPIISKEEYTKLLDIYSDLPGHDTGDEIKISLAWLLDTLDWKNQKDENVNVYHSQPLVIVCNKNSSAKDIENFSKKIINDVKTKTGIEIVTEVTFIF